MASRTRLAVVALLVLVIGIPVTYAATWLDIRHLSWGQATLLVALPPLISMSLAGASVVPSRTRPHTSQGDLLGVAVGSISFWTLVAGVALVGLAVAF